MQIANHPVQLQAVDPGQQFGAELLAGDGPLPFLIEASVGLSNCEKSSLATLSLQIAFTEEYGNIP